MKFTIKHYDDLKARVDAMDIRELVDVVSIPHFAPTTKNIRCKSEMFFVHAGSAEDIKQRKDELTEYKGSTPLFVSDFECGCGAMIKESVNFQSMYAFGKTNNPEAIYKIGRGTGDEGRRHGYTWSLAPCVDILINPESPVASIRTAGENADRVIKITGAYMKGMQDSGMAATLKHFPGDGATNYDQHLTTSVNPLSLEEWWASYGKVYRELINEGAMSIMPGHIALPCYDTPDENGLYPPASLSKRLLTDLLKGELGFDGIIVSDAINMSGFCGYMNFYEACAQFLIAGGDMLLFSNPTEKLYKAFEKFVADGTLPIEVLRNRAYRACCFVRYCQTELNAKEFSGTDMNELEKYVVDKSVEIIRDRNNVLPFALKKDTKILHAVVVNDINYRPYEALDAKLHEISENVTTLIDPGCDRLRKDMEDGIYDLVICSIGTPVTYGVNVTRIHGKVARNMMNGWTKFGTPSVFVNYANPYLYKEYDAMMDTIINTYGISDSVPDKVLELLFGKK